MAFGLAPTGREGGDAVKTRVIHAAHPNGIPHPLKVCALCGPLVRFGGIENDDRGVTCKRCLKILKTLCPTCHGTGVTP